MKLVVRPITVKQGKPFVREIHRKLPHVQGAMWGLQVKDGDRTMGVALVGFPARVWNEDTLCVLRVAVMPEARNACSMLYSACWRTARQMGAESLVTYTHLYEDGASLKAAGWKDGGLTDGGEHDREKRHRKPAIDAEPKRRWWAPGSARYVRPADALAGGLRLGAPVPRIEVG